LLTLCAHTCYLEVNFIFQLKFFWNVDINYSSFNHPLHLEDWHYSFAFCLFGVWLIQKNCLSFFHSRLTHPVVAREGIYR
jgi:hypothetical protein